MIFLTVGTQFPFDRLVRSIDGAISHNGFQEEIFAQIGHSTYRPHNFKFIKYIGKKQFDNLMQSASGVIGHAGMGTITMALECEKPILVMPRLKKYGEVVNDHQVAIAKRFEKLGHILVAYDVEDLPDRMRKLKNFVPRKRKASPHAVADRIHHFLSDLSEPRHA